MKPKILFISLLFCTLFGWQNGARGATRVWKGQSLFNSFWQTTTNWVGDVAPLAGDDLVFPAGALRLNNFNDFANGTIFNSIAYSGSNYFASGNSIMLNAGLTNAPLKG